MGKSDFHVSPSESCIAVGSKHRSCKCLSGDLFTLVPLADMDNSDVFHKYWHHFCLILISYFNEMSLYYFRIAVL